MPDETTTAPPPAQQPAPQPLPPAPPGWPQGGWADLHNERDRRQAAERLANERAEAIKAAEQRAAQAVAAKQALEARLSTYAVDLALVRAGLTDPDDMAEFRDRYERVQPGDDGKKPTADEWIARVKATPPKWAKAYFETAPPPAPAADAEDDLRAPLQRPPVAQPKPPPKVDPNAGATDRPNPPPRRFDDRLVARLTDEEFRANQAAIARDAIADGAVRISPELAKRIGLADP